MAEDFENAAYVGMTNSAGELHFASKALEGVLILGDMRQKSFDRDALARLEIFGFVDFAHPPAAQNAENPKTAEQDGADGKSGGHVEARRSHAKVFVERTARTTSGRSAISVAWLVVLWSGQGRARPCEFRRSMPQTGWIIHAAKSDRRVSRIVGFLYRIPQDNGCERTLMADFSRALELAWQAAADEALQLGSASLEPHHLLIGICSVEKALAATRGVPPGISETNRESIRNECETWTEAVAEAGTDTTTLRRAVRKAARPATQRILESNARIRRSAASQEIFARATSLAEADASPTIHLLHLAIALLEKPEEEIDAAFTQLEKRKIDLHVAALRRAANIALATTAGEPGDAAMIRIAAKLDASDAPYSVGTSTALDQERMALLYELPLRFGKGGPIPEMLQETVARISKVVPGASYAALLVKDRTSGDLLLLAHVPSGAPAISMTLAKRVLDTREACVWVRGQGESTASLDVQGVQSGIYAPLLWNGEALGVFAVSNRERGSEPGNDDLRLIVALAHHAAMALANSRFQNDLKRKGELLERLLTNFSPRIRNALLAKAERGRLRLGGEKSEVTILCSDIRGFTKMSEGLATDEIVEMLNDYLGGLVDAIFRNDGTIDKFMGDGILAVFGSPEPDPEQHEKAVRAACAMQKAMCERNELRRARGQATCEVGIGLHCGEVLHGFIGSTERMEFTVIGDAVNRAARYCAGAAGGEILVSPQLFQHTWQMADVEATSIGTKHEGEFAAYRFKALKVACGKS